MDKEIKALIGLMCKQNEKLDKFIDLLVAQKKVNIPEEDTGKKGTYVIKKDGRKYIKTGTADHPRLRVLSILIDGVTKVTGDKVDLTPKELAKYGAKHFDKFDEKLFTEKNGRYFKKT